MRDAAAAGEENNLPATEDPETGGRRPYETRSCASAPRTSSGTSRDVTRGASTRRTPPCATWGEGVPGEVHSGRPDVVRERGRRRDRRTDDDVRGEAQRELPPGVRREPRARGAGVRGVLVPHCRGTVTGWRDFRRDGGGMEGEGAIGPTGSVVGSRP
ncbi:hypothetical protein THAOC_28891 [Thalassiosira oceanica]|uniref:Uncharacterized protein n=1 Tax=Thalassiosira oceanica TaxID=159749 RepID=K0RHX4_THAOC|nr:hypothetical protein THAOC_28891 [Thalassiosira oceanica]|eukprot:EJK51894.1 hypothetical protein THAOC_28891 [Thalassiosira oceanica]